MGLNVRFVAGFSPIVEVIADARHFWGEKLSLPLKFESGSNYTEVDVPGLRYFGLWTLRDAAQSTFDLDEWPAEIARQQATIELEVHDVAEAVGELKAERLELLQDTKVEPRGQTTARYRRKACLSASPIPQGCGTALHSQATGASPLRSMWSGGLTA